MPTPLPIPVVARPRLLDAVVCGVASSLPSGDLAGEGDPIDGTACQALTLENADLDLGHVRPVLMHRGEMELDPAQEVDDGSRVKNLHEAVAQAGVEPVELQLCLARFKAHAGRHPASEADEFLLGAPPGHLHRVLPVARADSDVDDACARAPVLVALPQRHTGLGRQGATGRAQQRPARLVHAPHHLPSGLEEIFFKTRRAVSRLIVFILGWRRAASVSSAIVQCCAPGGGAEKARALISASASAVHRRGFPGRASSCRAKSSPPCRYDARVRQIAVRPTFRTCMITGSGIFRSSAAKMCARLSSRARCKPLARNSSTARRSFLLKLSPVRRRPGHLKQLGHAHSACSAISASLY